MELTPVDACTLCGQSTALLSLRCFTSYTKHISETFCEKNKNFTKQFQEATTGESICVLCAHKIVISQKFKSTYVEICRNQTCFRKTRTVCFICESKTAYLAKTDDNPNGFETKIKSFIDSTLHPRPYRQCVICFDCVFYLSIWCEVHSNVMKKINNKKKNSGFSEEQPATYKNTAKKILSLSLKHVSDTEDDSLLSKKDKENITPPENKTSRLQKRCRSETESPIETPARKRTRSSITTISSNGHESGMNKSIYNTPTSKSQKIPHNQTKSNKGNVHASREFLKKALKHLKSVKEVKDGAEWPESISSDKKMFGDIPYVIVMKDSCKRRTRQDSLLDEPMEVVELSDTESEGNKYSSDFSDKSKDKSFNKKNNQSKVSDKPVFQRKTEIKIKVSRNFSFNLDSVCGFTCNICDKEFSTNCEYKAHKLWHEKPEDIIINVTNHNLPSKIKASQFLASKIPKKEKVKPVSRANIDEIVRKYVSCASSDAFEDADFNSSKEIEDIIENLSVSEKESSKDCNEAEKSHTPEVNSVDIHETKESEKNDDLEMDEQAEHEDCIKESEQRVDCENEKSRDKNLSENEKNTNKIDSEEADSDSEERQTKIDYKNEENQNEKASVDEKSQDKNDSENAENQGERESDNEESHNENDENQSKRESENVENSNKIVLNKGENHDEIESDAEENLNKIDSENKENQDEAKSDSKENQSKNDRQNKENQDEKEVDNKESQNKNDSEIEENQVEKESLDGENPNKDDSENEENQVEEESLNGENLDKDDSENEENQIEEESLNIENPDKDDSENEENQVEVESLNVKNPNKADSENKENQDENELENEVVSPKSSSEVDGVEEQEYEIVKDSETKKTSKLANKCKELEELENLEKKSIFDVDLDNSEQINSEEEDDIFRESDEKDDGDDVEFGREVVISQDGCISEQSEDEEQEIDDTNTQSAETNSEKFDADDDVTDNISSSIIEKRLAQIHGEDFSTDDKEDEELNETEANEDDNSKNINNKNTNGTTTEIDEIDDGLNESEQNGNEDNTNNENEVSSKRINKKRKRVGNLIIVDSESEENCSDVEITISKTKRVRFAMDYPILNSVKEDFTSNSMFEKVEDDGDSNSSKNLHSECKNNTVNE